MPETSKSRLGHYERLALLGKGTEGVVYKARCLSDKVQGVKRDDLVAVKRLLDRRFKSFQQQVEILRRLNHPNIVRYRDSFELHQDELDEEGYCIVTELLSGENLKERINHNEKGLVWPEALKLMSDTLDALVFCSRQGVIHRDLKTSNIYVTDVNKAKLIDFGIARAEDDDASTVAGIKGTLDYMAPDFIEVGFHGDEQSDIFSFGVIFYEVLTGGLPFLPKLGSQIEYAARWMKNPPKVKFKHPVFDSLRGVALCLTKCLEIDRTGRYQSFQDLQGDFKAIRPPRKRFGGYDYEYVNFLGQGGFGRVFHAHRLPERLDVAIKELVSPDRQTDRFEREAKILKNHPHPHLVSYLDFAEAKESSLGRQYFLILEYLKGMPGASLRDRIRSASDGMAPKDVLPLFIGYLDCLSHLHQEGIIHRDIKPANLYAPEGQPEQAKIFDLGIAHDSEGTRTRGQVPGTLDYMPPEFASQEGGRGSAQSDIYSLGVTFYQALTCQLPFARLPTDEGAAWAAFYVRSENPQDYSFDHPVFTQWPALAEVVRLCLAHVPSKRYQSAQKMSKELERILRKINVRKLEYEGEIYEFGDCLGQGASGSTYQALRRSDGAIVVIKEFTIDASLIGRLEGDARKLRRDSHPHLVKYIDFVEEELAGEPEQSRCYLILEYLEGLPGASLRERLRHSNSCLELNEALSLFDGYLSCLEHLHGKRISHRDIHSGHLYAPAGVPERGKVFDLGFSLGAKEKPAAESKPAALAYTAPEASYEVARFSPKADIYSLGVALYEALTGQCPFPQSSESPLRQEDWSNVSFDHPVFSTDRGRDLPDVLRRAFAFDPQERYGNAREMREALARVPEPLEPSTPAPTKDKTVGPSPSFLIEVMDSLPNGPVRAGRKRLWVLAVEGVGGAVAENFSVTATSRTPNLLPQEQVLVKVEEGKVKITAQSLKTADGKVTIDVSVSSGAIEGTTKLDMEIDPIPPPRAQLLTPMPLLLAPKEDSLLLDFALEDDDVPAEDLSFALKVVPPDLVKFETPPKSGAPNPSLRLHRSLPRKGRGRIDVTVEADGRSSTSRFDFQVASPPRSPWTLVVGLLVLTILGMGVFFYLRPSLSVANPLVSVAAGEEAVWTVKVRNPRGAIKAQSLNPEMVPKLSVEPAGDGLVRVSAATARDAKGTAQINVTMEGTDLSVPATVNIAAIPHQLKITVSAPAQTLAGKELVWELRVSPVEDTNKVRAQTVDEKIVPRDTVQVEMLADGIIKVRATPPKTSDGTAKINVFTEGTDASTVLTTKILPLLSHLALLTPDALRLTANQDATQLKFSVGDDDLPVENLKFHFTVEPANLLAYEAPSLSGGAERSVILSRAPTFGTGTITVEVEADNRSISTNFPFQVDPNPCLISGPTGTIQFKPSDKEVNVHLDIYDPYTSPDDIQPAIGIEPADALNYKLSHAGTNWIIHLSRGADIETNGTVTILLQGRSGAVTNSFPFTVQAAPKPALSIVGLSDLHEGVWKMHDKPLEIPCRVTGSGPPVLKLKHSDNPNLLPDGAISFEPPRNPGANGIITLSPTPGKNGVAHINFDVTAQDALETNFSFQLNVEGEPAAPTLSVHPSDVILDEGSRTNLSFEVSSDYFPPEQLHVAVEPSASAVQADVPRVLSSNFSVALTAPSRADEKITFNLTDPNGRSTPQTVQAHFLQRFGIFGPTNFIVTTGTRKIPLGLRNEAKALQQMSEPLVTGSTGFLSATNWSLAMTRLQGSNVIDLTISPPGHVAGKDKLVVTATDLWGRTASLSISISFVPPLTNSLGMSFVWVAGLPGTGNEIWKSAGAAGPFQGGGWVAQYKVTQDQFTQALQTNPSAFRSDSNGAAVKNLPLENMTFKQAMDFCDKLTQMDLSDGRLAAGWRYTLPTVEQWSFYAASTPPTAEYAYFEIPASQPIALGKFAPNALGLFDVLGDVFELTRTPQTLLGKQGCVRRGGWCRSIRSDLSIDPSKFEETWWFPNDPNDNPNCGPQTGFRVILVPASAIN